MLLFAFKLRIDFFIKVVTCLQDEFNLSFLTGFVKNHQSYDFLLTNIFRQIIVHKNYSVQIQKSYICLCLIVHGTL
jgi:hypothetical protein